MPPRLPWLYSEHPIFFITACTHHRRPILACPAVHQAFIQFALRARERSVSVGRYVIMPDHGHLFTGFQAGSPSLSIWMKSFKNAISKTLTNATFTAPHWQNGFSIMLFDRQNPTTRSGVTFGRIRCGRDWFPRLMNGRMPARFGIYCRRGL